MTKFGVGLAAMIWAALAVQAGAGEASYDGIYRQAANADCAMVGTHGGAISIKDGVFTGVESSCRMTKPVSVVDMDATLFTFQCTGEGTVWSERAMIMHKAEKDGIIMVWNGYAFVYDRCSDAK